MGKALMVATVAGNLNSGEECNLFGAANETTLEASAQASATEGATFSTLGFNIISGGSGTNNLRFRDAGADGSQLATRAGAGVAEDAVNTDVLSAGDLFNLAYTDNGTSSVTSWIRANVEFASGHGNFHGGAGYVGVIFDVASATQFIPLSGGLGADGTATEANIAFKNRAYTSMEALQVRVIANARTNNSVFKNRINGADGTAVITFGAGVTGLIVDDALGDAITDGQTFGASITLLTGVEDLTVSFVLATLKSTSNKSETWTGDQTGVARAASATAHYIPIGGNIATLGTFTEAQARIKPGFAGIASNLRCHLSANTYGGDGTLKLFQNGSAVITTTIGASGGSAWYENTADSVTFDADDEFSFEFDEGTSGSITIQMVGVTFAPSSVTNYSLAANTGSYVVTGTAAGLRAARKIAGAAGSYAITGNVAIFNVTRGLPAAAGVYAITGNAAGLSYGRKIAAVSGVYAITGFAAAFGVTRGIAAAAGVYTITGSAAGLAYGRQLAVDAGAYAVTGSAAGLKADRGLPAAAGVYTITGSAAGLAYGRQLAAVAGVYEITGSAATFKATRVLSAAYGVYTIVGPAARLVKRPPWEAVAPSGVETWTDRAQASTVWTARTPASTTWTLRP